MPDREDLPSSNQNVPYFIVPVNPKKYAEFVSNLIKSPHVYSKNYHSPFTINFSSAISLSEMIQQRVHEQNSGNLVEFRCEIFFIDGSSITIPNFDAFNSFFDPIRRYVIGINFTWVYLIRFAGKEIPERQQIDVSFSAPRINISMAKGGYSANYEYGTKSWPSLDKSKTPE